MILYPHAQVSGALSTLPGENTKSASCIKAPQLSYLFVSGGSFPSRGQFLPIHAQSSTLPNVQWRPSIVFLSALFCSLILWYLALQILDALAFWTAVSDFSTQSVFCLGSLPLPLLHHNLETASRHAHLVCFPSFKDHHPALTVVYYQKPFFQMLYQFSSSFVCLFFMVRK